MCVGLIDSTGQRGGWRCLGNKSQSLAREGIEIGPRRELFVSALIIVLGFNVSLLEGSPECVNDGISECPSPTVGLAGINEVTDGDRSVHK